MAPQVLYRVIYGTANPEPWQLELCTIRPALLEDYRRHRVRYRSYPAIVPAQKSSVRGTLVTGLTPGDVNRLDAFEGSQYERKRVHVKVLQNVKLDQTAGAENETDEMIEAETFVWNDDWKDLEDEEWDFETFRRSEMKFWMGEGDWEQEESNGVEVDEGFADADAVATDPSVDRTGGRGPNGAIGRQLQGAW